VAESAGGYGRVTQSGGTLSVDQVLDIGGASAGAAGAVGEYNLGGGTCNVDNATNVGLGGTGTVNQTGGRYNSMIDAGQGNYLNIGSENGRGTYNLTGGTLGIDRYNLIPVGIRLGTAANGHGEFKLGDETSCGSIVEIGNGAWFPIDFYVRIATNSTGVFRGWSDDGGGNTLQIYGDFCNNGQVIADGYGQERSLDLSNMAEARTGTNGWAFAISDDNLLDNTTSNGWFAVNKGKLIFPGVAVSAATTYNWGERQGDSTIDAVNSARIKFNAFAGSGDLDGSLLAVDRSDVPAGPVSLISVHDLSLSGGASSDDFNLTIRYDDAAAGTEEADLKLFHYTGGKWVDTAATLDTGNKWITASNLTSFSEFGVGFEFAAGTMFKIR